MIKKSLADIRLDMEALKKLIAWRNPPPTSPEDRKIHLVPPKPAAKGKPHRTVSFGLAAVLCLPAPTPAKAEQSCLLTHVVNPKIWLVKCGEDGKYKEYMPHPYRHFRAAKKDALKYMDAHRDPKLRYMISVQELTHK